MKRIRKGGNGLRKFKKENKKEGYRLSKIWKVKNLTLIFLPESRARKLSLNIMSEGPGGWSGEKCVNTALYDLRWPI